MLPGHFQHFWDSRNAEIPDLAADTISHILAAIASSGLRTVHYTGAADEGLLRALVAHEPTLELSVMDILDRWGTGYAFWYDEREFRNCLPRDRPDWLEGISFYQEGAPDHEIAIRDWPWDSSDQLEKIIAFTGRKPPKLLIFTALALMNVCSVSGMFESHWAEREVLRPMPFQHPKYDWEQIGDLWLGRWKEGEVSAYERRQMIKAKKAS